MTDRAQVIGLLEELSEEPLIAAPMRAKMKEALAMLSSSSPGWASADFPDFLKREFQDYDKSNNCD